MNYLSITTDEQLESYCQRLSAAKVIAFDTEFVSEHTYQPVLCLIQVDADGDLAVIDPLAVKNVTPFWEVIVSPGHETVVHAGRGEIEFCLRAVGKYPHKLVDVQIAAALIGAEYPAGLTSLLSRFLGKMPSKHETRTDWRRRPLSKRQIEYALNDARYLIPLYQKISDKLRELGRISWLEEEMDSQRQEIELATSDERWRRLSGNAGLDSRGLAICRELFHWRDREARRRNQPARRILRDDLIVELARRGSADIAGIQSLRGMERSDIRHKLNDISAAIQRGLDLPEEHCPVKPTREQTPELSVLGQFLFAALGNVCRGAQLAPNIVANPTDIREWLVYYMRHNQGRHGPIPKLAKGWRKEFIGRLFENILGGKLVVRVTSPETDIPLSFEPS